MCDVAIFTAAREGDVRTPSADFRAQLDLMLEIARRLGYSAKPTDRVLDFGCGIGDTVAILLSRGVDAYGVDVGEWWGKDYATYWHDSPIPPDQVRSRLSTTTEANYRLPYPDNHFDLVISSQVFEHVFNYVDVFRELGRVTKPGGVSVHVFPGLLSPFEPHLCIPLNLLSKYEWWLRLWSLVKRRHRPTWKAEFEYLREQMKSNNYPSRSHLRNSAKKACVSLCFREELYIEAAKGRPWKILQKAPFLRPLIVVMCQRTMVIKSQSC